MSEMPTRGQLDHPELLGATQPFTITEDGRCEVVDEGPPSREDELASGTSLGDWRIHDKIGEGGMGTVYAAVHEVIGKRAAIKVVRRNRCRSLITADRFVQEARVVNEIGHPNIVDIF